MNTPTKEQICDLLETWIKQRPGLDIRDYGDVEDRNWEQTHSCYMGDLRPIMQHRKDALRLLNSVRNSSMTAEELSEGFSAFSGRLEIKQAEKEGEFRLSYCTGQYWPTEYRAAACAVLASALWMYYRENDDTGDSMRLKFKKTYGIGMQKRWFN